MTSNPVLAGRIALLAALGNTVVTAEEKPRPLTIRLSASMAAVTSEVIVRARVEPDARNRQLTIEWVADDLSGGSHAISLNGARAAACHHYALRNMAPGQYVVTAILRQSDGTEIRRTSSLSVPGIGGPEEFGASGTLGSAAGQSRPAPWP